MAECFVGGAAGGGNLKTKEGTFVVPADYNARVPVDLGGVPTFIIIRTGSTKASLISIGETSFAMAFFPIVGDTLRIYNSSGNYIYADFTSTGLLVRDNPRVVETTFNYVAAF